MNELHIKFLEFAKEWAVWLSSLQTGAIAALGVLTKDVRLTKAEKIICGIALLSFVLSILAGVSMIGAIPYLPERIQRRYPKGFIQTFDVSIYDEIRLPIGWLGHFMHITFALGIIFFAAFVVVRFLGNREETATKYDTAQELKKE